MTNNKIVFGDDESVSADVAWLWLNSHTWPGWRLEVVHALTPEFVSTPDVPTGRDLAAPRHPRHVFAEACFDDVVQLTIEQDPRLALSRHAELLVVGHRGPGAAKALHLGSTAEWLLAHPPSPMLIACHGRRTRTALVCQDGSAHAWAAIRALCRLPLVKGLRVTVLGVDDGRADVGPAVAEATKVLTEAGADARELIVWGGPTEMLLEYVDDHAPDLIVVGTHGLTGLKRLALGSTAGALAHAGSHSVLLACADVSPDQGARVSG